MNQATDAPHYVGLLELYTIAKVRQYLLLQLRCSEQLVKQYDCLTGHNLHSVSSLLACLLLIHLQVLVDLGRCIGQVGVVLLTELV